MKELAKEQNTCPLPVTELDVMPDVFQWERDGLQKNKTRMQVFETSELKVNKESHFLPHSLSLFIRDTLFNANEQFNCRRISF